jgi:[ribosomal protein S5]-alanine N-acetyltransferase
LKYLLHHQQTDRLLFREIQKSDFSLWVDFFKDSASFQYWKGALDSPEVECERWYTKQFHRYENDLGGMNALVEKESGKLVGHAGLLGQNVDGVPELEIAYSLLASFRNMGYATEAAAKCRDVAFESSFAKSLISIISLPNLPSANVARKIGMRVYSQTIYKENAVNIFRIQTPALCK